MANQVNSLVEDIKKNLSQCSASRKDEMRVMQAMLSDPDYEVNVYGKTGVVDTYNPCKDFRSMCSSIISSAAKVPTAEAETMMNNYSVKKNEASSMVNISKEFINTYLHTGRKLPLGGREMSDISLTLKNVPAKVRPCPHKIGVNEDGSNMYSRNPTTVEAHESIKVQAPCPAWIKGSSNQ